MSVFTGPEINNSGLVFYYDSSNSQKSWKGKVTTNYISNPTEEMTTNEFGQYRDLAPTFNTYGLVPYSLSMDIKVNKPGSVLVYMQNGSTTKYSFVNSLVNATTEYQRFYFNNITPSISNAGDTAATLATYTTYGSGVIPTVKNIQLEQGAFATPFVSGTRSNTQAILDLTGNNTITANSLTYSSDGTFSFNGTSNYITMPSLGSITNYTIDLWVKMNSLSGQQRLFSTPGGGTFTVRWTGSDFDFHYNPFDGSPPSTVTSATGVSYNTSTYYNLVATNSSSNGARFYVNGELKGTGERAIDLTGECYFGVDRSLTLWANCMLPVAKIYSSELSSNEIRQNFNALRGRFGA